jgi:spermidine synthase
VERLPLLLFVVSGFAALVLETVFLRQLTWVLGSSSRALALVLAAFLGGLALGAALFGRAADRSTRPLALFGILEGGTALAALGLVWLLGPGRDVLLAPLRAIESGALRSVVEIVLALGLLLVPTTLMGGTLPALGRHRIRTLDGFVGSLGLLYGLNTLGAALGTFVAGFLLFETLGVAGTAYIAILGQLAIAAAAILLARSSAPTARGRGQVSGSGPDLPPRPEPAAPEHALPTAGRGGARGLALLAATTAGLAALGYEVLWTRLLSLPLRSFTYSFSLMLSLFLLGLCLGALALWALAPRIERPLAWAGWLGIAMSGYVAASLLWLPEALTPLATQGWTDFVIRGAGRAALIVLPPTILSGMILPLATRACALGAARVGREVGAAYAMNTAGSITGALGAGLLLLPWLGAPRALGALALTQALAFAAVMFGSATHRLSRTAALLTPLVVSVPILAVEPARFVESFLRASRGTDTFGETLFFRESATDTIAVVRREYGAIDPEAKSLLTNGVAMTATVKPVWRYMAAEGHLPVLLSRDPRRALAIGVGTGITLAAVASHDAVESITAVELSEGVVEALPVFERENDRAFADPRVRLVRQDGRHWLETARERFGVVTVEPPPPIVAGAAHLYSREFYRACLERLEPGGVVAQWLPLHAQSLASARMTARTFLDAFPHVRLWLPSVRDAVLVGSPDPLTLDLGRVESAWATPRTRRNLDRAFLETPEAFLATLLLDRAGIEAWIGDAPPITDDRPRMEFFRSHGGNMTDRDIATLLEPPQAGWGWISGLAARPDLEAAIQSENATLRSYVRAATASDPRLHVAAARQSRSTEFFLYAFGCTTEQLARRPNPRCAELSASRAAPGHRGPGASQR